MMAEPFLRLTQKDTDVRFFHPMDERAFFEWLDRIPCVTSYRGEGALGLVVWLKCRPGDDDLRQLVALCRRYGVEMRQLAKFRTVENQGWFCD